SSSMQPPDTEPITAPSSRMAINEPGGRGEDPHVRSTITRTTRAPCDTHARLRFRTLRSADSISTHHERVDRCHSGTTSVTTLSPCSAPSPVKFTRSPFGRPAALLREYIIWSEYHYWHFATSPGFSQCCGNVPLCEHLLRCPQFASVSCWCTKTRVQSQKRHTAVSDGVSMKPSPFTYHDPHTIADAISLLGSLENARALAGGQSLMAMMNMRFVQPDHLIDLNRISELAGLDVSATEIRVGAMTRQRELEFSPHIQRSLPLMQEALLNVGHRQTRNRGTLGGSLCHLDPSAELVSVAATLDAIVTVAGPEGQREIPFALFPQGFMSPALEPNELLVHVRFPLWPENHGASFVEFARRLV